MPGIRLTAVIFTFRGAVVAEYFSLFTQSYPEGTHGLSKDNFATRKMAIQRIRCRKTLLAPAPAVWLLEPCEMRQPFCTVLRHPLEGVVRQALEMSLAVYRVAASQSVSR